MATAQPRKQIHALCHEHHIEMRLTENEMQGEGHAGQTLAYACPRPDCGVRYTPSKGYFLAANGGQRELDMTPRVKCPRDGQAMYLAETNPEKRAFRLWRCPECGSSRTNEEGVSNEVPGHGRP